MARVVLLVGVLLAATVAPAAAQFGFNLYRGGIDISSADMEHIREAVRAVLDTETVGETESFDIPESRLSGTVTLNEYFMEDDTQCSRVLILVRSRTRAAPFDLLLCQRPDGTWGIAG